MSQKEIEVILTRQLATYLAMPIFVIDTQGTLLFYNESAEAILGRRFDETGGAFGAFGGQMFLAELTNRTVLRGLVERVRGAYQGAGVPFRPTVGSPCRVPFAPAGERQRTRRGRRLVVGT